MYIDALVLTCISVCVCMCVYEYSEWTDPFKNAFLSYSCQMLTNQAG